MKISDTKINDILEANDNFSFEQIFKTYHSKLFAFARRFVKDKESARQLIMDVFLNLWNQHEKIELINNIESYLIVCTRNQCLNYLRSKNDKLKYYSETDLKLIEYELNYYQSPQIIDNLFAEKLQEEIDKAILKLPPQQQTVIKLSRIDGFSSAEIAQKLGLSKRTVETHIYTALKFLKENLKPFIH